MNCFDCGREFKKGDKVYEFNVGTFEVDYVQSDESFEQWCEDCEQKRGER